MAKKPETYLILENAFSLTVAAILLCAGAVVPASASPPISADVAIDQIKPLIDDDFFYLTIQGDDQYESARGRLAIDLYLTNNELAALTIDHVELDFDLPNVASIIVGGDMMMRCPSGTGTWMTGAGNLVMPAGASCRLSLTPDPLLALPAPAKLRLVVFYTGIYFGTVVSQRDLVAYENTTPTGSYRFPGRLEDLEARAFWSGLSATGGSHHRMEKDNSINVHAYDLGVIRIDEGGVWRNYEKPVAGETGAEVTDELEDFLSWGMPIYAMADGIVQACEGLEPDNDVGVSGGDPNYISILHGEELVTYAHLRYDSVSWELCAVDAVVKEGDLLGEIGNSGLAGGIPHLHVMATRDGHPVPLQFNDSFSIERTAFTSPPSGNAPWFGHHGHGLSPTTIALWPSGLRRRGAGTGVEIAADLNTLALTGTVAGRTVTAAKTGAGDLTVSLWDTGSDGEADVLDTETGGGVAQVALATPNGTQDAALALVTAAGNLKVSGFDISGSTLTRTVDSNSNPVQAVAASSAPFTDGVATAVITQTGTLKVIAWTVDADGSSIDREDDANGPSAEAVAVVRTYGFAGVVTAIRDTANNLRLDSFSIAAGGSSVDLEDEATDAEVQEISLARVGSRANGDDLLVSACRSAGGNLQLVSWAVDSGGNITRLAGRGSETILEVSSARAGAEHLFTAVRDSSGNFKLIAWYVADDGSFTRRAESGGGGATLIVQGESRSLGGQQMAVTAMRDSGDNLRIVVHQVQLTD